MMGAGMGWSPVLTRVVERAIDEARGLGHRRVGSEHLLLALLAEPEGAAVAPLAALYLQWEAVRAEIHEMMPGSARPIEGDLPLTESAAGTLKRAEAAARRLHAPLVDTDHLLLGIAGQTEGMASRVLLDFGATPEKVRHMVEQETAGRQTQACRQCGRPLEAVWQYCPMCGTARGGG